MNVQTQIADYLAAQPERKRADMQALHDVITKLMPGCRLWFLDGTDESGRTVSNPNIGYGRLTKSYANRETRELYQIGLSGNTMGPLSARAAAPLRIETTSTPGFACAFSPSSSSR